LIAIWKATLKIIAIAAKMVGYQPVKRGDMNENLPGPVSNPRIIVPERFVMNEDTSKFLTILSHLSAR
jgi:hypothetical protein